MPVILRQADYSAWLDPDNKDTGGLEAMLKPAASDFLAMHEVSQHVNSPRNEGPELLAAVLGK